MIDLIKPVHTELIGPYTLSIFEDDMVLDPRLKGITLTDLWLDGGAGSDLTDLGDAPADVLAVGLDWEQLRAYIIEEFRPVIIEPVTQLEDGHLSTGWNRGRMVGWVFVTRDRMMSVYNRRKLSGKLVAQARRDLRQEVERVSQFLSGEVYSFDITEDGQVAWTEREVYGLDITLAMARGVASRLIKKRAQTYMGLNPGYVTRNKG